MDPSCWNNEFLLKSTNPTNAGVKVVFYRLELTVTVRPLLSLKKYCTNIHPNDILAQRVTFG